MFFEKNKSIGGLVFRGRILLSSRFFNSSRSDRAIMIIHEAVVHKGFGISDLNYGTTVETGSNSINDKLYKYYKKIGSK